MLLRVALTLIALHLAIQAKNTIYGYARGMYYSRDRFQILPTKSDRVIMPSQELKLYNSSLGHIWVKEGVKVVKLIDCDN